MNTQNIETQPPMQKPHIDSFSQKISQDQHTQLQAWLSDFSYPEVQEFVAQPAPDGFGLEVSVSTLCRYHKTHFTYIDRLRQDKMLDRAFESTRMEDFDPYRDVLVNSAELLLIERHHELLTRPVESVGDLRRLASVLEQIKRLRILQSAPQKYARKQAAEAACAELLTT